MSDVLFKKSYERLMNSKNLPIEQYAVYSTRIGNLKIGYKHHAITQVALTNETCDKGNPSELSQLAYQQIEDYLNGKRKVFDLPVQLEGTPFQKRVWEALLTIDYGQTATYKDIARQIGNDKASRAIGMANNKNPIMIIVPCHRVIGTNGKLVGYAGGLHIKQYLLDLEK